MNNQKQIETFSTFYLIHGKWQHNDGIFIYNFILGHMLHVQISAKTDYYFAQLKVSLSCRVNIHVMWKYHGAPS